MRLHDSPEWSVQVANGLWYTLSHLVYIWFQTWCWLIASKPDILDQRNPQLHHGIIVEASFQHVV